MSTARRRYLTAATVGAVLLTGAGCSADLPATPSMSPRSRDADSRATVVHVIDGDTFDVQLNDGARARVRLAQIDAPERDECGYDAATDALRSAIHGTTVELAPTRDGPDRDPHGRLLRAAVHDDVGDVGSLIIRQGVVRWGDHYAREDPALAARYEADEQDARQARRGSWAACNWR